VNFAKEYGFYQKPIHRNCLLPYHRVLVQLVRSDRGRALLPAALVREELDALIAPF
jgi:hypothetical protein